MIKKLKPESMQKTDSRHQRNETTKKIMMGFYKFSNSLKSDFNFYYFSLASYW